MGLAMISSNAITSRKTTSKIIALLVSLLLLLSLTFPFISFANDPICTLEGTVTKVSNGDTFHVYSDGNNLKIRLYGIDAPETEERNKKTGSISKPADMF